MGTRIDYYTTQDMRNLIFKFYPGTYTPQKFGDVSLNWMSRPVYSSVGNIQATITALDDGPYHNYTYTYLKYCTTYVVGYSAYGVQILKQQCVYGGVRDLSGFIGMHPPVDIPAFIWSIVPLHKDLSAFIDGYRPIDLGAYVNIFLSDYRDLSGFIGMHPPADISAFIRVIYPPHKNLSAFIGMHPPADLLAYLNIFLSDYGDLPSSIYGWVEKDLPAYIRSMNYQGLPGIINPVPPSDLPAYLKAWPMAALPADIYGWDIKDLAARINAYEYKDLPVYIDMHPWVNLPVYPLRVWAREVPVDLPAFIRPFTYDDLSGILRATYLKHLSAYVHPVVPVNLGAALHGWDLINLSAFVDGVYSDYDLQAVINGVEYLRYLPAYIKAMLATRVPRDLSANVRGWFGRDITANISPIPSANLSAYLAAIGMVGNLSASIRPKVVRLTSIVSVSTMEHIDLSAIINPHCFYSEPRDLLAYIRCVHRRDLGATVLSKKYDTVAINLSASVGFASSYTFKDKLPITLNVSTDSYFYEDKFPIGLHIYDSEVNITAYIKATPRYRDLSAYIAAVGLEDYHFDVVKNKEKVYNLSYMGVFESFETVELSFKSIVEDYVYSDAGSAAWKKNRMDKWILGIQSFIPANTALGIKRKLHKFKSLYDLYRVESIDEAVRLAIEYVTSYPYVNFPASINGMGRYVDFPAMISARYIISTQGDLQASVAGLPEGVVVGTSGGLIIA